MQLPIQAQPVMRNLRTVEKTDNSGIMASWPPKFPKPSDIIGNPIKHVCQAGCRATQVAAVSACNGNPICIALAVQKGEDCFSDC